MKIPCSKLLKPTKFIDRWRRRVTSSLQFLLINIYSSPDKPSIHKRITTGREHCKDMKAEECEVVVGPAVEGELQVLQQVDHVQGQPADDENQKHRK